MSEKKKLTYIPRDEVELNSEPLYEIGSRPDSTFKGSVFAGAILIGLGVLLKNVVMCGFGLLFIGAGLYGLKKVRNVKALEVYPDCFLILHPEDENKVLYIPFDTISVWEIDQSQNSSGMILLTLVNGDRVVIPSYRISELEKICDELLHDKNNLEIYRNRLRNYKGGVQRISDDIKKRVARLKK